MISVAMAAYNGEKYIKQQLDSIMPQLAELDEVIISLDPSTDRTREILQEYASVDARVKLFVGPGQGLMANFENAIKNCNGDVIFLADQDDCWNIDKVQSCMECFKNPQVMVVLHDASVWDKDLKNRKIDSFFEYKGCKEGFWHNVIKNSYMGCCMAFRRELVQWMLPFPKKIPMHDQWIGLLGEKYGKCVFLKKDLLKYRRHEGNMTRLTHTSVMQMLKWRIQILNALKREKEN